MDAGTARYVVANLDTNGQVNYALWKGNVISGTPDVEEEIEDKRGAYN